MLVAPVLPGWDSLQALCRHAGFVLRNHRRIERVAVVADGLLPALAPPVAGTLLHPRVRHFRAGWLHAVAFTLWMLVFGSGPWPTLTLVVSLEAIFLSTFVMIGQNRQAAKAKAKADHDLTAETVELRRDTELTREVHRLTVEVHRRVVEEAR